MDSQTLEKMANSAFQTAQAARDSLYESAENAIAAKENLEAMKGDAVLSGKLDGKNAETRESQARALLADHFKAVAVTEQSERAARYRFDKAALDVDTVKTLLRIAELGTHQ